MEASEIDKKKYLIIGLFIAGLFILVLGAGAAGFIADVAGARSKLLAGISQKKNQVWHESKPGDKKFYDQAFSFSRLDRKKDFLEKEIAGGVIPHHLLAADLIADFYSAFSGDEYETIVLLGPNHFGAGEGRIITSEASWKTPYGDLEADQGIIEELALKKIAVPDEGIFDKEHAIYGETAFIKKVFPKAKFLPLVLRPGLKKEEAESLARALYEISKKKKILIIASVDFTHNADSETAMKNDRESIGALENLDCEKIYSLKLDSPGSIYTLARYAELKGAINFNLFNNSNSALLSGKPEIKNATSYVTGVFAAGGKGESGASDADGRENERGDEGSMKGVKESLRLLFFGDLMLDRHVGEKIKSKGADYPFAKLIKPDEGGENIFSGKDLVSANLEGAVTDLGAHYPPANSYDFAFSPDLIKSLKKYNFNFFNLANNHFSDQGERGIMETRENLKALGFDFSGCKDAQIGDCSSVIVEKGGKKIGLAGFSMVYKNFSLEKAREAVEKLKKETDLVIVNIHWGAEYQHNNNSSQKNTGQALIDSGADIIIGHHPHVMQGMEIYKGKPIFYSLGNFVFDQYFSEDTQEELALSIGWAPDKLQIEFLPMSSKLSQPELMESGKKKKLLEKFVGWSVQDGLDKENIIKEGQLIISGR
ncbi:MAG: AmmeMemoRadiSam system protein B [Patescibacteria group bacterium]|jgi:poly-gamma-glutamate synthesis protein (capsule biosynthesis protein)